MAFSPHSACIQYENYKTDKLNQTTKDYFDQVRE